MPPPPTSIDTRALALALAGIGGGVLVLAYLGLPWLKSAGQPSAKATNITRGDWSSNQVDAVFGLVLMLAFVVTIAMTAIAALRRAPHRLVPVLATGCAALAIATVVAGTLVTRSEQALRGDKDVSIEAGFWVALIALIVLGTAGVLRMRR